MFEAYSFMKTVGIESCTEDPESKFDIELLNWFDHDQYRQKWEDEKHTLMETEKNLLFALRDLAEADQKIINEITI